ncbi:MAG: hypothetical protein HC817_07185 [Saprospiraceae bacterium]|nr:hypothetical protein [Saprospiraceae bacterium]
MKKLVNYWLLFFHTNLIPPQYFTKKKRCQPEVGIALQYKTTLKKSKPAN